jgi:hypothetical protein
MFARKLLGRGVLHFMIPSWSGDKVGMLAVNQNNMKETTAWIIGIVAVVALVVGAIYWKGRGSSSENAGLNATSTDMADDSSGDSTGMAMHTTLGGIFDEPGAYECDYEAVSQQSRSTNVVYIADGKLRAEFRTQTATSSTLSMSVYDGSNLYVWVEGQPTGKISQPKTIADLPAAIPTDITSGRILGSGLDSVGWNCHAWSKDPAKLVKPSYVTFK